MYVKQMVTWAFTNYANFLLIKQIMFRWLKNAYLINLIS